MPLEELLSTIETLRNRAASHREHLQASSTRTRVSMVEPVLRALGWDTGDPSQVVQGYSTSTDLGKTLHADHLLMPQGHPLNTLHQPADSAIAIQVIPLGYDPHPDAWPDLALLCQQAQARTAVVTDGATWHIREARHAADRTVREDPTSLLYDPIQQTAIRLLAIWPGRP